MSFNSKDFLVELFAKAVMGESFFGLATLEFDGKRQIVVNLTDKFFE